VLRESCSARLISRSARPWRFSARIELGVFHQPFALALVGVRILGIEALERAVLVQVEAAVGRIHHVVEIGEARGAHQRQGDGGTTIVHGGR